MTKHPNLTLADTGRTDSTSVLQMTVGRRKGLHHVKLIIAGDIKSEYACKLKSDVDWLCTYMLLQHVNKTTYQLRSNKGKYAKEIAPRGPVYAIVCSVLFEFNAVIPAKI